MSSLILRIATRVLAALLLVFSIYMLLRGHNAPGGGFIGGLLGATGFILYGVAHGVPAARIALRVDPRSLTVTGLVVALAAGLWGLVARDAFFVGLWWSPAEGLYLSTVLLFDIGVYLVVMGAVLTLVFALEEEV